uniref:Cullin family profile domain-containing protein n=1 Tax=Amphimedon queenslandica TaxID=400682 RepID=A0A1X7SVP7_AMPQE
MYAFMYMRYGQFNGHTLLHLNQSKLQYIGIDNKDHSLLVHIYGGQDLFVNEYRTLLSDRLLLSLDYDVTRELRNLELLKLRFGESNLHYCEVMIKDITDSRRVNGLINNKLSIKKQQQGDGGNDHENDVIINSFILSHIFWPSFRIETMKLPAFIQKKLDDYNKSFQEIKGMRELKWCHDLGQVQLELEVNDQILNFQVSPSRASVIWQFQNKSVWSVEDLSTELESTPSVIRRHLLYWAGQGVLCEEKEGEVFKIFEKEGMDDTYHEGGVFEEESAMSSMKSQKENDLE